MSTSPSQTATYQANAGETNRLITSQTGDNRGQHRVNFVDLGPTIVPGAGCERADTDPGIPPPPIHGVKCFGMNIVRVVLQAGDGDDVLEDETGIRTYLYGEAGDDKLVIGRTPGGGGGANLLAGGDGFDLASYVNHDVPVIVTVGAGADDGLDTNGDGVSDRGDEVAADIEAVLGGSGGDRIIGADANNRLRGGPGNDVLDGAGGNDSVTGGVGADALRGGPGTDRALYNTSGAAVIATIGSGANDGEDANGDGVSEEGDDVQADVEGIVSGSGADRLTGDGSDNNFESRGGPDTIFGGGGRDFMDGGAGGDAFEGGEGQDSVTYAGRGGPVTVTVGDGPNDGEAGEADDVRGDVEGVRGGAANDALRGNDIRNHLNGGPGGDSIDGAGGEDEISGGDGDDSIAAFDGARDEIRCGAGTDSVSADQLDEIAADCENVERRQGDVTDTTPPEITIVGRTVTLTKRGRIPVRLRCPASEPAGCLGTLRLHTASRVRVSARRRVKLGSRSFTIAGGRTKKVAVRVSRRGRRIVRRRKTFRLRATIVGRDPAGNVKRTRTTLVLRTRKR